MIKNKGRRGRLGKPSASKPKRADYSGLSFADLRALAKLRGVNTHRMNRAGIEAALEQ